MSYARPLRLFVFLVAVAASLLVAPTALAQSDVVGSADFRNAPQLPPGEYTDRIVTGDTAWYAILYSNNTPYEFEVSYAGADPGPSVDLSISFVAPTLKTIDGPSRVVAGTGVEYPAGHTNVWFLKVTLSTSGQTGIEYPIRISVGGVQSVGTEPCNDTPGCVLDEDYASLNVAVARARMELEAFRAQETKAAVEAEIANARGFAETSEALAPAAEARLAQVEATVAQLCAPEPICDEFPDQGSTTPLVGWIGGFAVLGFGAWRAVKRLGKEPEEKQVKPPPRQPAALRGAKAKKK